MIAEIIAVGEEVLAGDTINSNAATISKSLAEIGISCRFHSVVGDVVENIFEQLEQSYLRSDVIIFSGGLGPTDDDLTKESVAEFFDMDLVEETEVVNHIKSFFKRRGRQPSKNNFKQALIPDGAIAIENPNGTAPGIYIERENKHIFLLPGPPRELNPMMEDFVLPRLQPLQEETIISRVYPMVNIGESQAVTVLEDIMQFREDLVVAPYAKLREVMIKVTAKAKNETDAMAKIQPVEDIIKDRLGDYIYTFDQLSLVETLIKDLRDRKETVSTAESCTGGLIASGFVDVPGASDVFMEGLVTYSNQSKENLLGVSSKALESEGAVSEMVAMEMAQGLLERFKTTYGISVTGIAGPGGGSDEKPVGLVYIGIASPEACKVYKNVFIGNRTNIREQSMKTAYILLWETIHGKTYDK